MKKGFTLAEVLVTLGIIGVVSALTVPTLMKNHQKKTFTVQLHKVYSEFQQAAQNYMNDNNAVSMTEAGLTSQAAVEQFSKNYFKTVNHCNATATTPCFAASYKNLDGTSFSFTAWGVAHAFSLASGAAILVDYPSYYSVEVDGHTSRYGDMLVDVNGPSGPNIAGRDLFLMEFYEDGTIDVAGATPACRQSGACGGKTVSQIREDLFNSSCFSSTKAAGCLGKILNDGWKMTY